MVEANSAAPEQTPSHSTHAGADGVVCDVGVGTATAKLDCPPDDESDDDPDSLGPDGLAIDVVTAQEGEEAPPPPDAETCGRSTC